MIRTALLTAALAALALTTQAQQGRRSAVSHAKQPDTAGKVAVPVGPVLPGEETLSAQERAERTFLMPVRKKMPSAVRPGAAPRPQLDPASADAVAIGPPTAEEAAEEAASKAEAAKTTAARSSRSRSSSARRSSSSRSRSSSKKSSSARRGTASKKKSTAKKSTSKSSAAKKKTSSRRRR
ncbi:hypothetical protein D3Y59_17115 [Hymenobacter oligotrophus]|uniref:Uncharacterized protein n=1 Tax=Hymenobacter oligotrophus TaxID=2319843 RepID=A0A3B7RDD4_9BACT|nr:hypothetical protein [Hymenobacter oligotrophus]AYA38619.1 hypothetical protein D3Y59_17115 [Hymenobacter oligotrophus]